MGSELYLTTTDDSLDMPSLSKNFKSEIIDAGLYFDHREYLTEPEIEILTPNYIGEVVLGEKKNNSLRSLAKLFSRMTDAIKGKPVDYNTLFDDFLVTSNKVEDRARAPAPLKAVLKKVQQYLIDNAERLPIVHVLYDTPDFQNEVWYIEMEGDTRYLSGDLWAEDDYDLRFRDKVMIGGENGGYVEVKPLMEIGGQTLFTKTISKAEQFAGNFQNCFDFLDQAIELNEKILWEHD